MAAKRGADPPSAFYGLLMSLSIRAQEGNQEALLWLDAIAGGEPLPITDEMRERARAEINVIHTRIGERVAKRAKRGKPADLAPDSDCSSTEAWSPVDPLAIREVR